MKRLVLTVDVITEGDEQADDEQAHRIGAALLSLMEVLEDVNDYRLDYPDEY